MKLENIREKKVYIELDKKREIRFDLNAMAELEEIYGDLPSAMEALHKKMSVKAMRALLYAGLKHEDETLTLQQVGSMVKMSDLSRITEKITEAFKADTPDMEDVESLTKSNSNVSLGPAGKKS